MPSNWVPDETRAIARFRVTCPGTLSYLERQFNAQQVDRYFELKAAANDGSDKKRQKEAKIRIKEGFSDQVPARLRPELSLTQGYAPRENRGTAETPGTIFDSRLLIFALQRDDGPYRHLDLAATLQLTGRIRESILAHLGDDIPEVLSGHAGAERSERPHVSIFPCSFDRTHTPARSGFVGRKMESLSPRPIARTSAEACPHLSHDTVP